MLAVALAFGMLACSSGDGADGADGASSESVAELHESGELAESTRALLGDDPPADPDELADAVAARITTTLATPDTATVGDVGRYLGAARSALDGRDDDGTVAYAARLAWGLGGRLAPEADDGERLSWVVPDPEERPGDERLAIVAALESGDAADVADALAGTRAATVAEQAFDELAGLVPVDDEADLLTTLQTAYTTAAS